MWHRIPGDESSYRHRRLIATAVCRQFISLLSDPRLLRMIEMSEAIADHQKRDWNDWEMTYENAQIAANEVVLVVNNAAARAIAGLGFDDHKIGRAIEVAVDVFGYLAAIREGVMRPNATQNTTQGIWSHPVFISGRDNEGGDVVSRFIRDVIINPFHPINFDKSWRTDTVVSLANGMYITQDFSAMPILADALQDVGCNNHTILEHCRDRNVNHVRGCWVVDLVLDK
jgi:hypothetical protein